MNTKRVFRTASLKFSDEDNLTVYLPHRHVIVLHPTEILLHFVQFVIVGGKESACAGTLRLVQILHYRPRNAYSVVSRRATAKLIEEHKRARRHVIQDIGGLGHLHHKGRFAKRNIIRRTHTSENFVHQTYFRALCRHKAAHLSHQHYQGRLTQQSRLSGHIRTRYYHYLLAFGIEHDVVRHITLAHRHLRFNHGVASAAYLKSLGIVNLRPYVIVFLGRAGERKQAVEPCDGVGIGLNLRDKVLRKGYKLHEKPLL